MKWLDRFRKKSIEKIPMDDLRREKIRLEQEEAKLIKKVEQLEDQKKSLFRDGTQEDSDRKQLILARKIKQLDAQARNYDKSLRLLSRQIRVITGFVQIKENRSRWEEMGVSSVISKINMESLQDFVEKATVDNQFHMDKFAEILGTIEEGEGLLEGLAAEDEDTMKLVELMNEVKAAGEDDTEAAIDTTYKKLEQTLHKEAEEGELA